MSINSLSTNGNKTIFEAQFKEMRKEKEKKIKELKGHFAKLEKGLVDAKKMSEEKYKKNAAYIIENEVICYMI
jgi:hypothetical protein